MQVFFEKKATYAGCTNHFLSHEFDFGLVLGRCFEKIRKNDTPVILYKRLKVKENKLYVEVLSKLCKEVTVLVVDGGGRGAALVDKYSQSKQVGKILAVPGNDLMQINTKSKIKTYPDLKTTSVEEIIKICKKEKVDLVDVAQDNAVEAGLVDLLNKEGIKAVGPTKGAGKIEWDKAWAREFMKKHGIPAPKFYVFNSQKGGIDFVKKHQQKWFVKAAGLAEGKGVIPATNTAEAISAIEEMQKFGNSGKFYLLEEWLEGEEFSAFALVDGSNFQVVGFAQDYKRVFDGDKGSNTGGMGCVSNPLIMDENIKQQTQAVFQRVVNGLKKENRPYKGVLYLGGMVVDSKVYVIEFNARWGDPEAEVILSSLKNDLLEVNSAIISGNIKKLKIKIDKNIRVAVAATAKGYPQDYKTVRGKRIFGIEKVLKISGIKIYGAGIKKAGESYIVNGGRILFVVGSGKDVVEAKKKAYEAMKFINIEGDSLHYRTDIGWRDVERMQKDKK